jgi:type IV secretion system protein VirB4
VLTTKNSDSNLFNSSSEDFVPVACHYDKNTLLTKNGELLQTIEINGIHSEKISKDLFSLRAVVRKSIAESINCTKFAFWIHTIRRKANLDDPKDYPSFFPANVHDIWRRKNYWHDKFVNRLYITIVHDAPELKLKSFNSIVNSLFPKTIANFEEKFFSMAVTELNNTVDSMLEGLSSFGAEKLGIRFEGEECFSDPMFLYRRIMQLNEENCPVPISDISKSLASHNYTVGSDKIEVVGESGKKFAAMMSIKEYQEVSAEAIDRFLQIPVEMVATEVFYFVDKKEVAPKFEHQNYILGISGDEDLKKMKGIDKIFDENQTGARFCHQQISFMVMGNDLKTLDNQVSQASETLSRIGIVHVREDINLEKTFWAQLPANFSFLSRMKPAILENVAALASLHNFPTGHQYSRWGRAVTLLRTEKGTPYFMNFHDEKDQSTTCIFGEAKSGKTTLLNFLLSESDKFQPTTIYITDDMDSGIYTKARGGRWFQRAQKIVNPLMCLDNAENREFIFEFFKIITKHYFDPMGEKELGLLKLLSANIFDTPLNERSIAQIFSTVSESKKGGKELMKRIADYIEGGKYYGVFEDDKPIILTAGSFTAFNLQPFDDKAFTKQHYPKEKKLIDQFNYDLNSMRAVKAGIVFAIQKVIKDVVDGPKIFAIDNAEQIINFNHYGSLFEYLSDSMNSINGAFISTINSEPLLDLQEGKVLMEWIDKINTKFILPSEIRTKGLDKLLRLDLNEFKKLSDLNISSRMFLIKQDGKSIASELSIGGLMGLTRMFCSGKKELDVYLKTLKKFGDKKPDDWVGALYDALDNA